MNQVVYAYRCWLVETHDFSMRFSLKKPVTKAILKEVFNIPDDAKVTPILDNRMKNGGRKMI